jgi:hypothetical protein
MPRHASPHTIEFGIGAMSHHIKKTAQGNYDITHPGDTLGTGTVWKPAYCQACRGHRK